LAKFISYQPSKFQNLAESTPTKHGSSCSVHTKDSASATGEMQSYMLFLHCNSEYDVVMHSCFWMDSHIRRHNK